MARYQPSNYEPSTQPGIYVGEPQPIVWVDEQPVITVHQQPVLVIQQNVTSVEGSSGELDFGDKTARNRFVRRVYGIISV